MSKSLGAFHIFVILNQYLDNLFHAFFAIHHLLVQFSTSNDTCVKNLLFMIIAGEGQHRQHLQIMATISKKIKNEILREQILNTEDNFEVYNLLIG